jgi:NAD(P)-dependent dehydrogenase (short-subunit alcohol dehydrogenase family)
MTPLGGGKKGIERSISHMSKGLFDLTGKVTLVTGGNSGLGLGFARGIAKQGGDLMLWARSAEKNAAAKAELEQFGVRVETRSVDVASEEAVIQGMAEAAELFGRIDCVIANAGISNPAPSVLDLDSKRYHDLLAINMHGAFYTLREGARHMVARAERGDPGGSLIACGSLSLFLGVPGMEHYAAAKGGVATIVRGMALELGKYGIRANVVAPGYIKTDLGRDREGSELSATDEFFASSTPIPRVGYPEDFEGIIAYLASDAARFHTGDTIVIDGGYLIKL